ncbi:MAG: hypothetical protein P8Y62_07090 [candidate division WOR-3 bacterium]|jgi:hypothetical protein
MPSLMPGMPGTKEAFAISVIKDDLTLRVPPKAITHYGFFEHDYAILTTGHVGESGFGMIKKETALRSVFKKFVKEITSFGEVMWFNDRAFVMLKIDNGVTRLNEDVLKAFYLQIGDRLMVGKSTTVTMSFVPVEIWERNFKKHGFYEAIENMKKLEEY